VVQAAALSGRPPAPIPTHAQNNKQGHLVREVDALGGLMARIADASGIQFHLLNASKGPAVRGPRAQMDRAVYKRELQAALRDLCGAAPNAAPVQPPPPQPPGAGRLQLCNGVVEDLLLEGAAAAGAGRPRVCGVKLASGERLRARTVVLTTGTFLGGVIHIGSRSFPAGRLKNLGASSLSSSTSSSSSSGATGSSKHPVLAAAASRPDADAARSSGALAATIAAAGFRLGRLKTGTPPRLDGRTIDYRGFKPQPTDARPTPLSFTNLADPFWRPRLRQLVNYEARTTAATEAFVLKAVGEGRGWAPEGVAGPRYCPSLEAKAARFPGRTHAVSLHALGGGWYPRLARCKLFAIFAAALLHS